MRLDLDLAPALTSNLPDLHVDQIRRISRKYPERRQRFLGRLIASSYERKRPHAFHPDADALSRDYLTAGLRASPRADGYKRHLAPFYDFESGNAGYSRSRCLTKPYWLKPSVESAIGSVYAVKHSFAVVDDEGNRIDSAPTENLPSQTRSSLKVPALLPITRHAIDGALAHVEEAVIRHGRAAPADPFRSKRSLETIRRQLLGARLWFNALGGLPNLYALQGNGRLGPDGWHLIQVSSVTRRLLLAGSGLVDYDIASCHWSIFVSLGRALGFSTSFTEDYCAHKDDWHAGFCRATGHGRASDFKGILLSWLTGGQLNQGICGHGVEVLGRDAMSRLSGDARASALFSEIGAGMREVRKQTRFEGGRPLNAVGEAFPRSSSRRSFGSLNSHLLTGYEQFAIRAACGKIRGLLAIIYDGFIAPPLNRDSLSAEVRSSSSQQLGITIDVAFKATPFPSSLADCPLGPPRSTPDRLSPVLVHV